MWPSVKFVSPNKGLISNKNTKCPIDAHCHRHRRKDLRFTKDCIEFLMNFRCFGRIFGLLHFLAFSAFLIVMAEYFSSSESGPFLLSFFLTLSPILASNCKQRAFFLIRSSFLPPSILYILQLRLCPPEGILWNVEFLGFSSSLSKILQRHQEFYAVLAESSDLFCDGDGNEHL